MSGFGDEDFYPDLIDKAAVLCWRLWVAMLDPYRQAGRAWS